MADNYLEKKYEDMLSRRAKEQRLRQAAWKKRMDAYRKKSQDRAAADVLSVEGEKDSPEGLEQHP